MLSDSFGVNLAIFLLGQAVAWVYLRTGLVPRGVAVLIATWVFADLALVLRFAYGDIGQAYVASLAAMQAISVFEAVRLLFGLGRRRRDSFRSRRDEAYRAVMLKFLRNDLDGARAGLRAMVRIDPWDLQARLLSGVVLARQGRGKAARRHLSGARRLDRDRRYIDAIESEFRRLAAAAGRRPSADVEPELVAELQQTAD